LVKVELTSFSISVVDFFLAKEGEMKTKSQRFVVELTDSERSLLKALIRRAANRLQLLAEHVFCPKPTKARPTKRTRSFMLFVFRRSFVFVGGFSKKGWILPFSERTLASEFTVNSMAKPKRH
jgi:hypothetical protein